MLCVGKEDKNPTEISAVDLLWMVWNIWPRCPNDGPPTDYQQDRASKEHLL